MVVGLCFSDDAFDIKILSCCLPLKEAVVLYLLSSFAIKLFF